MLICIPTSRSKTQYFINQAYADYVQEAGYTAVMFAEQSDPIKVAGICDGLLLPGGIDLDPTFYGEDNVHSIGVDPAKDDYERSLLHAFISVGKPIFGICRGFQLLVREYKRLQEAKLMSEYSVYYQHINDHSLATSLDLPRFAFSHSVFADRNYLYNEDHTAYKRTFVNSMHHQALLLKPGRGVHGKIVRNMGGIIAIATAAYGLEDSKSMSNYRVAEAIMIRDWGESRIMAVQWHPEELKDIALLKTFFANENGTPIEIIKESESVIKTKKTKSKTKTAENMEESNE